MRLRQVDVTGSTLVGAITKELGTDGPKHYAIVLGQNMLNGSIYIAELMKNGYQITTYQDFVRRYKANGPIQIEPNKGIISNAEVARRALAEVENGSTSYDLLINNCESFVNRATHGKSTSSQVINSSFGVILIVGLYYLIKSSKT
jgi:Lecithin retinol acyltransferase